jgi:hypothetical protein
MPPAPSRRPRLSFISFFPIPAVTRATIPFLLAILVFVQPAPTLAQRSSSGRGSRPTFCLHDCADPNTPNLSGPDADLKSFDQLMAVQATNTQSDTFADLTRQTQAAIDQLHAARELAQSHKPAASLSAQIATLDVAIKRFTTPARVF